MDKKGEINNLTKIIKPDVKIILNIGHAHFKTFRILVGYELKQNNRQHYKKWYDAE